MESDLLSETNVNIKLMAIRHNRLPPAHVTKPVVNAMQKKKTHQTPCKANRNTPMFMSVRAVNHFSLFHYIATHMQHSQRSEGGGYS